MKFNVIQHDDAFHEDLMCIEILEGEYKDVIFQYDNLRLVEDSDEEASMNFNFITVKNEQNLDLTSEDFIAILGEILNELLRDFIDYADRTDGAETPSE